MSMLSTNLWQNLAVTAALRPVFNVELVRWRLCLHATQTKQAKANKMGVKTAIKRTINAIDQLYS